MRTGTLRGLINKYAAETSSPHMAYEKAADDISVLMESGKVKPSDFSFRALFEELVDPQRQLRVNSPAQSIAEAISSSAFPVITNRILHGTIMPEYQSASEAVEALVTEENATKTQSEDVAGMTDIDGLEMRPELMPYEETSFGEKNIRIFMADFGRIISLSAEAIFDDRTGEVQRRARNVGKKAGQHRTQYVIQTLEMSARTALKEANTRGFVYNGNVITQANFYNADHSAVIDNQVNANITAAALGTAGLTAGMLLFDNMVDTLGDPIVVNPTILLVPGPLRVTAWQLTSTPTQYDTANRAMNYFGPGGGIGFRPMVSNFLTSNTRWFLGSPKDQLLWVWVWKPATATQGAESTKSFENQIVARYRYNYNGGVGHTNYRYIIRGGA